MPLLWEKLLENGWSPDTCDPLLTSREESAMEALAQKPDDKLSPVESAAKKLYNTYYKKA